MSAIPNKSKCCNAKARSDEADEGTVCYMCSQCGKPCDVRPQVSSKRDELAEQYKIDDQGSHPTYHNSGRVKAYCAGWDQAIEEVLASIADMHLRTLGPSGDDCVLYDELMAVIKSLKEKV